MGIHFLSSPLLFGWFRNHLMIWTKNGELSRYSFLTKIVCKINNSTVEHDNFAVEKNGKFYFLICVQIFLVFTCEWMCFTDDFVVRANIVIVTVCFIRTIVTLPNAIAYEQLFYTKSIATTKLVRITWISWTQTHLGEKLEITKHEQAKHFHFIQKLNSSKELYVFFIIKVDLSSPLIRTPRVSGFFLRNFEFELCGLSLNFDKTKQCGACPIIDYIDKLKITLQPSLHLNDGDDDDLPQWISSEMSEQSWIWSQRCEARIQSPLWHLTF